MQAELRVANEKKDREKDENEGRLQLQLSALNENLATLRADLTSREQRLKEAQEACQEAKGHRLGQYSTLLKRSSLCIVGRIGGKVRSEQ